jgi:hypothetical protein
MRRYFFTKSILKSIHLSLFTFLLTSAFILGTSVTTNAQATLSVQGIVKKSNGVALEDGEYSITFKMYAVNAPTVVIWDETIPNVEVISGIYSVVLGSTLADPLNIPFDADYELGITIGSQEMLPRIRLTSAPYALSLRGETNQFPSTGQVLADDIKVANGVLASGGAPGVNGVDKNGYAFSGNNGDNDSGLFSTQDGKVSMYANNVEKLSVTSTEVTLNGTTTVQGTIGANNINLYNDGRINYSTTNGGSFLDWRLANVDEFSQNTQGWSSYAPVTGQWIGWNQSSPNGGLNRPNYGVFAGHAITPSQNNQVLKKQFTIPGSYSQIKVKFRYFILDSWDNGTGDLPFAAFASDVSGTNFRVGWTDYSPYYLNANGRLNTNEIRAALNFQGQASHTDHWVDAEMTGYANGNTFWVYFGAALDSNGDPLDESFAIGYVEIWVR